MTRLGVAIIPSSGVVEAALALRGEVVSLGAGGAELGRDRNLPHISLLQAEFRPGLDVRGVLGQVKEVSAAHPDPPRVAFGPVRSHPVDWLFWLCVDNQWLRDMHGATLDVFAPLIDPRSIDRSRDLGALPPPERTSYQRYGYRYAGPAFLPHITLGRVAPEAAAEVARRANHRRERTGPRDVQTMERLTIYRVGRDGAHAETLEALDL